MCNWNVKYLPLNIGKTRARLIYMYVTSINLEESKCTSWPGKDVGVVVIDHASGMALL